MTSVQIRHLARLSYGDSLPDDRRVDGPVAVYGSNGQVGVHDRANTAAPVIVVGRKGSHGKLQYSDEPVFAIDTTYFVDPRSTDCHMRWLFYALSTLQLEELSFDVGVPGLAREAAYTQRVSRPTLEQQRAIADFLDAETARIDRLVVLRGRQLALMKDRWRDAVTAWVAAVDVHPVPFGRFIHSICQGVSPVAEDRRADRNEWSVLKLSAVKDGRFWPDEHKVLAREFDPNGHVKPQRGSLLITRANTPVLVGEACAVEEEPERILLSDLIYRVDVDQTRLVSEFAAAVLGARQVRGQLSSAARGTSQTMVKLRGEDIRMITIPVPASQEQKRLVEAWHSGRAVMDKIAEIIRRQVALLLEHRQALITAAVTGEIDVSTASGRGVPA